MDDGTKGTAESCLVCPETTQSLATGTIPAHLSLACFAMAPGFWIGTAIRKWMPAGSSILDCPAILRSWEIGTIPATSALVSSGAVNGDRKSTRLNSSHLGISYAVFCLKKNKG